MKNSRRFAVIFSLVWIFHGDADPTVPVEVSRHMSSALKAAGATSSAPNFPAPVTTRGTRLTIGKTSSPGYSNSEDEWRNQLMISNR
jgi:predicted peptidase